MQLSGHFGERCSERRRRSSIAPVAALCLCVAGSASASILGLPPVDTQNDDFVFQYFADADDIHVITQQNSYRIAFENDTSMRVTLMHQRVAIPGISAPAGSQEAVDAITTASRPIADTQDAFAEYVRTRKEATLRVQHRKLQASYYVSTEEDYFAQMVQAQYDRDFRQQTINVAFGGSYGWDSITPLEDADTSNISDHRNTAYVNGVVTAVLTKNTILRLGAEQFWVEGLQHNPYRNVWVAGSNVAERHPDRRSRHDLYLRLSQYLAQRTSLKLYYKMYFDDWGVRSQTLGTRLNQYITDNVIVRYRYRYYDQGASDFYRDDYDTVGGVDGYQTADYRMADLSAHLFGTRVRWSLVDRFPESALWGGLALQVSYERYFNTNNFSANIFEAGVSLDF